MFFCCPKSSGFFNVYIVGEKQMDFSVIQRRKKRLVTQPPFLPHLLLHGINSQVTIITCLDSQRRQVSIMPCFLLHFSGGWGRRKAKLSSHKMLSPLAYSLRHTRMYLKYAFQRWTFLYRKGSFPGSKTKISASKIYASKNYGFSFIT